jgi:CO/xanthine dehydrogenase FAD-binding subunit
LRADPAAECGRLRCARRAVSVRSSGAERWIDADAFVTWLFVTALEPGELLTAIEIPAMAPRTGWAFAEMARRHGDFALAGVACVLSLDESGRCARARVSLFGVGDGPVVSTVAARI